MDCYILNLSDPEISAVIRADTVDEMKCMHLILSCIIKHFTYRYFVFVTGQGHVRDQAQFSGKA